MVNDACTGMTPTGYTGSKISPVWQGGRIRYLTAVGRTEYKHVYYINRVQATRLITKDELLYTSLM